MADYIDKQKTLNVIFEIAENVINSLPSADAVEVVRCRDCKYYDLAKNGVNGICNRQYGTFDAYDFCSYGEKNEAS